MSRRRSPGDWLTSGQAAAYLGVSRQTIHNWVTLGMLPPAQERPDYRWPRFARANLEALKKAAAAAGRPINYYLAHEHKRRQGIPDGRVERYADRT